jgi:hypothetical protein
MSKFVQLAVSKDKSNYILKHPFRDYEKLVATDGNRVHYIDQDRIDKPHGLRPDWIDGNTYPSYAHSLRLLSWLPSSKAFIDKDFAKQFNALSDFAEVADINARINLTAHDDSMTFLLANKNCKVALSLPIIQPDPSAIPIISSFNANYLNDVFQFAAKSKAEVLISFANNYGAIKIALDGAEGNPTAIIMGLRTPNLK